MKICAAPGSHRVLFAAFLLLGALRQAAAEEMAAHDHRRTELSTALTLTINGASTQLSLTDLAGMPQTTVKVHNAHTNHDEGYTGVSVADLLARRGLIFNKESQARYLHSYLRAQGTDFYFVLYSAAEIQPALHDGSAIVATQVDGHALGEDGRLKLVSSGEQRPARWVRNLTSLTLVTLN